jgi:uncharacterized membrane protein YiaA
MSKTTVALYVLLVVVIVFSMGYYIAGARRCGRSSFTPAVMPTCLFPFVMTGKP